MKNLKHILTALVLSAATFNATALEFVPVGPADGRKLLAGQAGNGLAAGCELEPGGGEEEVRCHLDQVAFSTHAINRFDPIAFQYLTNKRTKREYERILCQVNDKDPSSMNCYDDYPGNPIFVIKQENEDDWMFYGAKNADHPELSDYWIAE